MTDLVLVMAVIIGYVGVLFVIAWWAERAGGIGQRLAATPLVYALSLAVYCTTWTYYGSVGFAATGGLLFLTVYLGPTLAAFSWWWLLRKLVRLKQTYGVTSLPDVLSLRYGKSQGLGTLATLVCFVGLVPYLALQIKTMISTVAMVTGHDPARAYPAIGDHVGPPIILLMLAFTIVFGIRRLSPAERHPGMMVAIAAESVVKLVAFVAAGLFVTYGLFDGFSDLFRRALEPRAAGLTPDLLGGHGVTTWLTHLVLSASAIFFLPRQFHVAVVENSDERHIRTAMWLFPAYLLAINVFVVPIALGGLVLGLPAATADSFVLTLPHAAGARVVTWLVFLGGISAGTGMVMVETMALATMISNHVVLPAGDLWRPLRRLRRHLLTSRWCAAAFVILVAFAYERAFGGAYELVSIGLSSFAAVFQLAPAVLGGLLWRRASTAGAAAAIGVGLATWTYTLVIPVFARAGWLPPTLLTDGPWGLSLLRPEALFGVGGLDHVSHAVLWSAVLNVGALVFGSLLFPASAEEDGHSADVLGALAPSVAFAPIPNGEGLADLAAKRERVVALLSEYHDPASAERLAERCIARVGPRGTRLGALQLAELQAEAEAALASTIGTAAAHAALLRHVLVTPDEAHAVSQAYAKILADLRVSPAEMRRKIDYHRERERLLAHEAAAQRFLAEVSARLAASLDVETTAQAVVHLPVPHIVDAALLWLAPAEGEEARTFLAFSEPGRERRLGEGAAAPELPPASVARALESRRPVINAGSVARGWPASVASLAGCTGEVTLPLLGRQGALGTLSLFLTEASTLHIPRDLPLAEELAHLSALALENATLYHSAADAVRARDEFLAIASHELKTPLTPLQMNLEMLQRLSSSGELASLPQPRLAKMFGGAERQVQRLTALVNDLLDVSRITSGRLRLNLQLVDVGTVVREVVERHRAEIAAAGCDVSLDLATALLGRWDPLRIDQVVTNLLMNALKYAPGAPIEITVRGDDATARVVVRDRGPGIRAEDQQRIFLPFERAVSYLKVSGFGLGLFIVRQIVKAHGGAVRLEDAPGGGAAFVIELPRHTLRAASA